MMIHTIRKNNVRGFTVLELLVVIAIIGVMSAIMLVAFSTARQKSRDARRKADMQQIFTALNIFYDSYGCLPITTGATTCFPGYAEANAGGWDYSSQGGFMTFLETSGVMSDVPVDPINNMTGDGVSGQYAYRYYCYPSGTNQGLHLGYYRENGAWAEIVKSARTSPSSWSDSDYLCK
ncbi:MAG: Type secretion system protein, partial [Candidatus Paceibacter sp.]|jgi:prepilin-type N-terminal cleavage/methylation domain-containing protein|nr:Type secretion system protein [Candidatus Paceibacter sp.]